MIRKLFLTASAASILMISCYSQSIVPAEWKFITGDKPEYIDSAMNDYWWEDISPLELWESQGFSGYDGFRMVQGEGCGAGLDEEECLQV